MTGAPGAQRPGNGDGEPADSITRGFLFADLRGYTEYVERHGGEAAAHLLGKYRKLVREQVALFRGAEIKTEGDSFYVVFPSVSAAVRAGLAILQWAARETEDPQYAIRVGIGVHAGETIETSEGYVGSPVNIAARLCAQAAAGELLVSDTVRALTSTVVRAAFIPKGRRRLKGIAEPMQVFAVSGGTAAEPVRPALRVLGSRRVGLALAAIALVVVAVVGAAALGDRGARPDASPPPSQPSPTTALASPTAGDSGLTTQERNLLERVPTGVAEHCQTAPDDGLVNATATVRCELPLGSGADTVWWDYFETRGQTILAFDRIAEARELPDEPCGRDIAEGRGEWRVGSTLSGGRLCYLDESRAWVAWSYPSEQILARAVRADGDYRALDGWWIDIAPFLKLG